MIEDYLEWPFTLYKADSFELNKSMFEKKNIVLLGATGSIGESTLRVICKHSDRLSLVGIAAHSNYKKLAEIAFEFGVEHVAIFCQKAYKQAVASGIFPPQTKLYYGMEGLNTLSSIPEANMVVVAIVGTTGLRPTLKAIQHKKAIAVASKEILVMAGELVTKAARRSGVTLMPIDSEHSGVFQCLEGEHKKAVKQIILTASGGAFRSVPLERLKDVTPEEALMHPTWKMGPKVTLDCATMANKGLELIEAHWLFNMPANRLNVLMHPQSLIHAMVEFCDGSFRAQISPTHMAFPIQYALLYPERRPAPLESLDFGKGISLELMPVDYERYPCLKLAQEALIAGGNAPTVFNAVNEVAVNAFIERKIRFMDIVLVIDSVLQQLGGRAYEVSLDAILDVHEVACKAASQVIGKGSVAIL